MKNLILFVGTIVSGVEKGETLGRVCGIWQNVGPIPEGNEAESENAKA
jgi:hypothetical protein